MLFVYLLNPIKLISILNQSTTICRIKRTYLFRFNKIKNSRHRFDSNIKRFVTTNNNYYDYHGMRLQDRLKIKFS